MTVAREGVIRQVDPLQGLPQLLWKRGDVQRRDAVAA